MVLAVIPARYASSRFPGKPLAILGGVSMIRRVYERVAESKSVDEVVVATDDQRIYDHVQSFGGQVVMTEVSHPSGTDRVAEAATHYSNASIIVNVQGDEPFIHPSQIDQLVGAFGDSTTDIATLAHRIEEEQSLLSPNVVKVVRGQHGQALYFSRHAIPFLRDVPVGRWLSQGRHLQHLGVYAYRVGALEQIPKLPVGYLEGDESLEQLRWLEHGLTIRVETTEFASRGIDTPADLERAEADLQRGDV